MTWEFGLNSPETVSKWSEATIRDAEKGMTLAPFMTAMTDGAIRNPEASKLGGIIRVPMVMLVNPSVPAKTVPEFIAYAKANPDKINMASAGTGSAPHMAGELFNVMAGVKMVHVPYRGQGPALTDLLAGQVQVLVVHLDLHGTHPGKVELEIARSLVLARSSSERSYRCQQQGGG